MWEDVVEQERSGCSGVFLSENVEELQWVAVVKFRMNDRSGDGTGSFWSQDKDEDSEVHEYDNSKI